MREKREEKDGRGGREGVFLYLKDVSVVVLFEVVGEGIGVHEGLSALTEDIDCTL